MRTVRLKARTDKDGTLALRVPTDLEEMEMDVTLVFQPRVEASVGADANGWPVGFFDRTAGSIPDIERLPQGEYEVREDW